MTTSLTGAIGWAPQVDKTTAGSLANTVWHAGRMVNLALTELTQPFDQEIGGNLLPAGLMKLARWAQGDFECYPRTQKAIGWLIYCVIGNVSSSGAANTGYTHLFPGANTRDNTIPNKWLTIRRITPADDPAYYIGETFVSCKVTALALTIAAGAILSARFTFEGLDIGDLVLDPAHAGAPWTVATEDSIGVPVAPESSVVFSDGTAFDALQNITINIANNVQDPRQELQVGSYAPRNVTMLGRNLSLQGTRYYDDPAMYRKIRYGGAAGVNWDKKIYYGGNQLSMVFKTQYTPFGSGDDVQGEIGFRAKRVGWAAEPLQMQGGNPIALQITGTVVQGEAAETEDYQVWLKNDEASYAWPAAGGAGPTLSAPTVDTTNGVTHIVLTLSAPCEALADPKLGFTLYIDPTGASPNAQVAITNAYFNDTTHLHLVTAHSWVNGDTGTIAYNATNGCLIRISDGVKVQTLTTTNITNSVP